MNYNPVFRPEMSYIKYFLLKVLIQYIQEEREDNYNFIKLT